MLNRAKAGNIFRKNKKIQTKANRLLFISSAVFTSLYIIWRTFFTIPTHYGALPLILGIFLLVAEASAAVESLMECRQMSKHIVPELPEIPASWYPDVDIFIATHNEPVELLYKTLNACTYLEYPDRSRVHVYLCDDNNRPEMAELARKLGVGYFGLEGNKHAKAGNLNNAMRQTHSPLVVTLDSDMIPTSEFLMKSVPYFFLPMVKKNQRSLRWEERTGDELDPNFKIGFIQTPQSFYNPDLFQYNFFSEDRIPNEQDFFFREVNVGRNADNGVIYAGSNTVLSRAALEEVGYIATGSITEDFLTGMRIQEKGYTTFAVPEELAHGLAPNTIISLLKQRERWGRGCVQGMRQGRLFTKSKLPLWTRISYMASWMYWWTFTRRLIYTIAPIMAIIFNIYMLEADMGQILLFWLPHYLLYNQTLKTLSGNVRTRHWSNVYDTTIFPFLVGPIIKETLGIRKLNFVVTDKTKGQEKKDRSYYLALPHLLLLGMSLWALVICVRESIQIHGIYSPLIFYWLIVNIKNLFFAILFMRGRPNMRMAERYQANVPVELDLGQEAVEASTIDISETGLAIRLSRPVYVGNHGLVPIIITCKDYWAEMKVKVVHVAQVGEEWKYSMHIEEMDDHNRSQYMQIVYDRGHTMPRQLDSTLSVFDDFNINVTKRVEHGEISKRTMPRIKLDIPFRVEGIRGVILDFNYYFVSLSSPVPVPAGRQLSFFLEPGIELLLVPEYPEGRTAGDHTALYRVANSGSFLENPQMIVILDAWKKMREKSLKTEVEGKIVPAQPT